MTATPTRWLDPTLSPTSTSIPCNWANFISDITVPDNWDIGPGRAFTKTWRLGNIGFCAWTNDYSLVFDHGDRMGAPVSKPLTAETVPPGRSVNVSVNLVSPAVEGSYGGFFKLRAPDGALFGIGSTANGAFWVKIKVTNATKTPTVTRTSIPTVKPSVIPIGSRTPTRIGTPVSLPETQVVTRQVVFSPGWHTYLQARCPDGWVVTGGGFTASDNLHVYAQHKAEISWNVYAENTGDAAA